MTEGQITWRMCQLAGKTWLFVLGWWVARPFIDMAPIDQQADAQDRARDILESFSAESRALQRMVGE